MKEIRRKLRLIAILGGFVPTKSGTIDRNMRSPINREETFMTHVIFPESGSMPEIRRREMPVQELDVWTPGAVAAVFAETISVWLIPRHPQAIAVDMRDRRV